MDLLKLWGFIVVIGIFFSVFAYAAGRAEEKNNRYPFTFDASADPNADLNAKPKPETYTCHECGHLFATEGGKRQIIEYSGVKDVWFCYFHIPEWDKKSTRSTLSKYWKEFEVDVKGNILHHVKTNNL